MNPILTAVIPRIIVTAEDGFLARVPFQAVSFHSGEVNSHGILVASWWVPAAFSRFTVLERIALVPRRSRVLSIPGAGWKDSRQQNREDRSTRGETSADDADVFFNNGPEWRENIVLDLSATVYNFGDGSLGLTCRIRTCRWEIKSLHSEDTRYHYTVESKQWVLTKVGHNYKAPSANTNISAIFWLEGRNDL